jgi:hypothetical protein
MVSTWRVSSGVSLARSACEACEVGGQDVGVDEAQAKLCHVRACSGLAGATGR